MVLQGRIYLWSLCRAAMLSQAFSRPITGRLVEKTCARVFLWSRCGSVSCVQRERESPRTLVHTRQPGTGSLLQKPVLTHLVQEVQANGTDDSCVTFVLHEEDHTLGNSLRYMIMKNPEVEFCGYCITHPSESKINFRIQTRGGLPAVEPFRKGLNELVDVCQHVLNTFEVRMQEYKDQSASEMD